MMMTEPTGFAAVLERRGEVGEGRDGRGGAKGMSQKGSEEEVGSHSLEVIPTPYLGSVQRWVLWTWSSTLDALWLSAV